MNVSRDLSYVPPCSPPTGVTEITSSVVALSATMPSKTFPLEWFALTIFYNYNLFLVYCKSHLVTYLKFLTGSPWPAEHVADSFSGNIRTFTPWPMLGSCSLPQASSLLDRVTYLYKRVTCSYMTFVFAHVPSFAHRLTVTSLQGLTQTPYLARSLP